MLEIGDVVVFKDVGLKKFLYDYKGDYRILPAREIINIAEGEEDWEEISRSASPMYIDHVKPERQGFLYEEDAWITVMGINGIYGTTPNRLKKVPSRLKTWCGENS